MNPKVLFTLLAVAVIAAAICISPVVVAALGDKIIKDAAIVGALCAFIAGNRVAWYAGRSDKQIVGFVTGWLIAMVWVAVIISSSGWLTYLITANKTVIGDYAIFTGGIVAVAGFGWLCEIAVTKPCESYETVDSGKWFQLFKW